MVPFILLLVFLFIIGLTLAFARMSVLSTRLADLDRILRNALGAISDLEKKIEALGTQPPAAPAAVRRGLRKRPAPATKRAAAKEAVSLPRPVPAPVAVVGAGRAPAAPPAPAKSRTKEEWEALIGGKLLNRIGALALILGVGFFLQYAFANDWISEPVRVLIGVLFGGALLVAAARGASGGYQIFAEGLVGAGIAILYLSVYASFNYYHLVAQMWAFVFMSAVTVITFSQAFRYNSIAVALLGLLGGFLTPFLLSTGEVNPVGLFTYLAVLDLGLLVVAWRMDSWMSLEPLSIAGTYLIYALWLGESYAGSFFIPGLLFLGLFWVMFHSVHAIRVIRGVTTHARFRLGLASVHGAVFYVLLYALLNIDHPEWRVASTLVVAILYGATSLASRGRSAGDGVFLQSTLSAILLVLCATFIQFKGMALVQYLSVEALALTWAGAQWRLRTVWGGGVVLFVVAFLFLLGSGGALFASASEQFTLILNIRAFTFLLLVAGLSLSALLVGRLDQPGARVVRSALHVAWCGVLLLLITVETNDFFAQMIRQTGVTGEQHLSFLRAMVMPVVWGVYALFLMQGGSREENRPVVTSGVCILFLAGCIAIVRGLTYIPIGDLVPVWNERVALLIVLIAVYVLARRILGARPPGAGTSMQPGAGIQAGIVLLFLVLITGEIWDYFALGIYRLALAAASVNIVQEMSRLQNLRQLFLSAGWLVYSIILMTIGIWRRARIVRIEAIILFGVSILKIFIYDLSFLDTLYRIFSFVGLGVILLAVSYLYQRYRGIILGSSDSDGTVATSSPSPAAHAGR